MDAKSKEREEFFFDLSKADLYDLFTMVLTSPLGFGAYRKVFEWGTDYVVKYEKTAGYFANMTEMKLWRGVKDDPIHKWFAPCLTISPNGQWLIQARTTPVTLAELKHKHRRIPKMFCDLKVANWGWYKGRIVCHDYANLDTSGLLVGTQRPKWWTAKAHTP